MRYRVKRAEIGKLQGIGLPVELRGRASDLLLEAKKAAWRKPRLG